MPNMTYIPVPSREDRSSSDDLEVRKRLYRATLLCASFLLIEVVGGYLAGSLAVLSDAAHLFADLASFAIAIAASHLAALPPTERHTFGLKRSESLAALISMLTLAIVSIGLAMEAVHRVFVPHPEIDGMTMSVVSAIGVVVNVTLAFVLGVENHVHLPGHSHSEPGGGCACDHHPRPTVNRAPNAKESNGDDIEKGRQASDDTTAALSLCSKESDDSTANDAVVAKGKQSQHRSINNVNLQAAYLHVLGDLMQSVAVLIAGLIIWVKPGWKIIDPICTLVFASFVFYSTLGVLRSSLQVIMEEVPPNVNRNETLKCIKAVKGVLDVTKLHIWSISHGETALNVHCTTSHVDTRGLVQCIRALVQRRGIQHSTIEIETVLTDETTRPVGTNESPTTLPTDSSKSSVSFDPNALWCGTCEEDDQEVLVTDPTGGKPFDPNSRYCVECVEDE